ncbi:MAG: hypothetical protein ABIC95_02120 [archaeon]
MEGQKTSVWAILALVFSILFAPLGLIFAIVALVRIKKDPMPPARPATILCELRRVSLLSTAPRRVLSLSS